MIDGSNLTTTQKKLFKALTASQMNVVTFSPKTDTTSNTNPNLIGARVIYLIHIAFDGTPKTIGKNIDYDASTGKVTFPVKAGEFLYVHYTS